MKIALITDTHWGIRNDNTIFHDNNKRFLENIFFPFLDEHGVVNVIHLGDIVDRRKYINFLTAKRLREDFLEPLAKRDIQMNIIAGNHDVFYKNTNNVNALDELLAGNYPNVHIHIDPIEWTFDNTTLLLLPWINDENREKTLNSIKNTTAKVVMGHLELSGFEMFKGSFNTHGDDPSIFDKFDLVCSGHFHHRSTNGNISYLGSHAEFTWSDYDDPRGFHILDTDTLELKFIQNPYKMFKKIWYNDKDKNMAEVLDQDFSDVKNCYVKVIVVKKENPYWFDMFTERLEKAVPYDIQIIEDNSITLEETDAVDEAESTIDIFKRYIDQVNSAHINKEKLESTIVSLYNEALTIG